MQADPIKFRILAGFSTRVINSIIFFSLNFWKERAINHLLMQLCDHLLSEGKKAMWKGILQRKASGIGHTKTPQSWLLSCW